MFRKILVFSFLAFGISFAQVRDLFAEFEAEANAMSSSAVAESSATSESSAGTVSSSSEISSSSIISSSSLAESSSSVSSSSVSSSSETSSSSIAESSSAMGSSSSVFSSSSSSSVVPDSALQDSLKTDSLKQDTLKLDSASLPEDSLHSVLDTLKKDTVPADSLKQDTLRKADTSKVPEVVLQSSSSSMPLSSSSVSRRDILGPVKVSKVYGMDELKGRYKSPRKALFMSLVIPGAGQLYVGGSTFTNIRGAAYLALEATLWGSWYYFSVHKYDDQVRKYKKFAKNNFSIGQYELKMHDLFNSLSDANEESNFRMRYLKDRESYCKSIYGNAKSNGCYDSEKTFNNDGNHTNRFDSENTLGEDLKNIKLYDASDFYQQIANRSYVLGWLDVENEALVSELELSEDVATVSLGTSKNQETYRSMRSKANDYANLQAWFFGGIILNHLISAIDAALTANAHNKVLYEEKVSFIERTHLEGFIAPLDGNVTTMINAYWNF